MITKEQLAKYGITGASEIVYNPSYDQLFEEEMKPELEGFEKGQVSELGAVNVMTGVYTGRSPKDKWIVKDDTTKDNFWWTSEKSPNDNKAISTETWSELKNLVTDQLSGNKLYVVDAFCGANADTRLKVRFIMEVAWQAHFVTNMFLRPSAEELENFGEPDFIVMNGSKTSDKDFKKHGTNSETFVAFNMTEKMQIIGGTWYGGEMKKGMFAMMNYYLPLRGIASMHCSANVGKEGDVAILFGLSGTGKTTLSADPKRRLIGDDEHCWSEQGTFNIEGGCYAKAIDLSAEKEPDIFNAIRFGTVLENVVYDKDSRKVDYTDVSITQNTRASYPIQFIDNVQIPCVAGHPENIIFLTCDAFGVLPPVSKLTPEQASYHFISGYTAKVAGTEMGVTEPTATFSACFGAAFMMWHPNKYAELLAEKIKTHKATAWLVNTGWTGTGSRMKLKHTRAMIDAIHHHDFDNVEYVIDEEFGFQIPTSCPNVPSEVLIPRNTWEDKAKYEETKLKLVNLFNENFKKFAANVNPEIVEAGPKASAMQS